MKTKEESGKKISATELFRLGDELNEKRDFHQSIAIWTKLLKLHPNSPHAYLNFAISLFHLKRYEVAIANCSNAIKFDPNFFEAYYFRGCSLVEIGQHEAAIVDYTRAIALDPNTSSITYGNRGHALNHLGQYEAAIADYTRAIELDPNDSVSYANRGIAYDKLKAHKTAIANYTRAIELNLNFSAAYANRGQALSDLGQHEDAIVDYTRAIELDPNFSEAYLERGKAFWHLKRFPQATLDFSHAMQRMSLTDSQRQIVHKDGICYHYYSLEGQARAYTLEALSAPYLYFSSNEELASASKNDRHDLLRLKKNTALPSEVQHIFENQVQALVHCLTEESDSHHMWGGYASNGQGICVGYDLRRSEKVLRSLNYFDRVSYPAPADFAAPLKLEQLGSMVDLITEGFFTKHPSYKHENEIRALRFLPHGQALDSGFQKLPIEPMVIAEIYFGDRCNESNRQAIYTLAKKHLIPQNSTLRFYEMKYQNGLLENAEWRPNNQTDA